MDKIHKRCELLSFLALIIGVPIALVDLHVHAEDAAKNGRKERLEAAEKLYRDVDERYIEFMRICIEHPRLDCYSVAASATTPPLSEDEKLQQRLLYSVLTDVFEVAYVEYHKDDSSPEITRLYKDQWDGWDSYIRKFLSRPAYRQTWFDIRDEYDKGLVAYMNAITAPPKR